MKIDINKRNEVWMGCLVPNPPRCHPYMLKLGFFLTFAAILKNGSWENIDRSTTVFVIHDF